ncbi:hypothetical protein LEP1GSC170_2460 [Leptospira interrogans serovar Bataviae str. HAI135]|nr:hypothetical protein LEP1GSC170_2460 [Leptospira interrogans serovar Bataviae str. HAI135]
MRLNTEAAVGKEVLFKRLQNFATEIKRRGKEIHVSGKLFSSHLENTFQNILKKGLENKLLKLNGNGEVLGTEKLIQQERDIRNLKKEIYFYITQINLLIINPN